MESGDGDRRPPLTGVVIITLPPADNPSLGKTITAFTLSDSTILPIQHTLESDRYRNEQLPQTHPPILTPHSLDLQFSFRRVFLQNRKVLFGFLAISLLAFALYSSPYTSTIQELRDREDEDKPKSFIFPLFQKSGGAMAGGDVELKLGRFVGSEVEKVVPSIDDGIEKKRLNFNKLISSKNAIDSSVVFPVRGNVYPDGLYYTYILVGSPPRRYHVDIDTGSDLTWIQCDAPCTSCGKGANPLYKPKQGKIVTPRDSLCMEVQTNQKTEYCPTCKQCDYEIEYADHSSSMGVLARDELHLKSSNGSLAKLNVVFGCAYDQQGLLLKTLAKTDGILGLSKSRVSLPSQLASLGVVNNVLGHCLAADAVGGGFMFMGDDFVPNWGMTWIPMLDIPSSNFYESQIVKMRYGSRPFDLGGQGNEAGRVIFDSGSSYTYFTKQAYSDLVSSLKTVAAADGLMLDVSDPTLPVCWRLDSPIRSVADVKHLFKTITLQFGSKWWILSTKMHIPPEGYLIISNKGNVCLGILDGSGVLDESTTIIGDVSLRGKLLVYDNVNHRIGLMQSNCIKPHRYKSLLLS